MSDKQTPILRETVRLAAATAANRFVTAAGEAPIAGGSALGPTYLAGKANETVAVTALGISSAVAGHAFARGGELEVMADGRVRKRRAGNTVVAVALEAASAADDTVAVHVIPNEASDNEAVIEIAAATAVHRFVEADGTTPTANGNALGPVQKAAAANEAVPVRTCGPALAVAKAAVAKGAALQVLADGRVETKTGNHTVVARALEAAAAENDVFRVNVIPN